jgi:uncharacterized membrane protein YdbT with pleckstrin-like domain
MFPLSIAFLLPACAAVQDTTDAAVMADPPISKFLKTSLRVVCLGIVRLLFEVWCEWAALFLQKQHLLFWF